MCGSRIRRCVPDPCSRSACVHAGACSDAPAAAGSAAVTTVAAAVVVSVIRISAAGGRTGRRHAASGPPPVWGRGHDGAVGRAGQPVHARLRVGVHMADERREPEDGQRFPSCVVEDRRRRRPSGRGTVFCQVGVGRFGVSFSPCERRVSGRFGVGRSCWLLVIALVIA